MATVAKRKKKLVLSREVKAFAKERGLTPYLPRIVDVLQDIFADAAGTRVEVHQDPEVAELRWLLFGVEVPWETSNQALHAKHQWYDSLHEFCPASVREEVILMVRRRP